MPVHRPQSGNFLHLSYHEMFKRTEEGHALVIDEFVLRNAHYETTEAP